MASAIPTDDCIAGRERARSGETFDFLEGGKFTRAEEAPDGWTASKSRDADPRRPHRGAGYRSAAGAGRPS